MALKTFSPGERLFAADLNDNFQEVLASGATGGGDDRVFFENDQTVTQGYTITFGKNAITGGPVTISSGVVVTIPSGSEWTVV